MLWSCTDLQSSHIIIHHPLLRLTTRDDENVRACMYVGEIPIHNGPLKDRSRIDESKHTGMPKDGTEGIHPDPLPPPIFNSEDLIGHTFL
jgi:hypothetical protein